MSLQTLPPMQPSHAQLSGRPCHFLRGMRVLLDSELARLYGVPVAQLNRQVLRNRRRFPEDFVFRLDIDEARLLRPGRCGRGGPRHRPWAFTEQGACMLAGVLDTTAAVRAAILACRMLAGLRAIRPPVGQKPSKRVSTRGRR